MVKVTEAHLIDGPRNGEIHALKFQTRRLLFATLKSPSYWYCDDEYECSGHLNLGEMVYERIAGNEYIAVYRCTDTGLDE